MIAPAPRRTLRRPWPFHRLAVVLSGGGALGAYEVGVLKALGTLALRPAIVVGLSVGAINAVVWTAHDFDTRALERAWSRIGPASVGMRWGSLTVRLFGLFLAVLAAVEIVLTVMGSAELSVGNLFRPPGSAGGAFLSAVFDTLAWILVGALGYLVAHGAREVEDRLARLGAMGHPERWQRAFGGLLLVGVAVHLAAWALDLPWPHRFSATVLLVGALAWLLNRRGRAGDWLRRVLVRLLPESGGRGLWRGLARQRLVEGLVAQGEPGRLVDGGAHLMLNALAVDSGRMCYFVNWADPSPAFRASMERALADIHPMATPAEVTRAATASSAVPILFRPVRIGGRDYLDAGMFSSQALHAALADGADALLLVVMSPAAIPRHPRGPRHLLEIGGWLLELGNWRDLRGELQTLPGPFSREGNPAPVCVVEPERPLPGRMLRIDPRQAVSLVERGEEDAWAALERAGWLAPDAPGSG